MKLGFVSAIMDGWSFEEVVDFASASGFSCLETACWPKGDADRRYAGVSHMDIDRVLGDEAYREHLLSYAESKSITISALAYYPNTMDGDLKKREANIAHLRKVIRAAHLLGVGIVTTFIGRDQTKNVSENMKTFQQIWPALICFAEENGVNIAIENCPMLFGEDQWPGGQNLMTSPVIWREMFAAIPSRNFGLNFDPSHFVWQGMDYIRPIYEFRDRLMHIHFKDIKLFPERMQERGTLAYPLDYMAPKLPGLGDVNWSRFISALTDIGFDGFACIEVEDRAFEGSKERILQSILLSKKYISQYLV